MKRHAVKCEHRKRVCRQLMESDDRLLHVTALKVKHCFYHDIEQAALFGKISMALWAMMNSAMVKPLPC